MRGLAAIPDSTLLELALADYYERVRRGALALERYERLIADRPSPLLWVQFMRCTRRVKGIADARQVFIRCRKSDQCSWQCYVASALMEHQLNKDANVARKVFEAGMRDHAGDAAYVLHYLHWTLRLNDDKNTRVLFERALKSVPAHEAADIWRLYLAFETESGDQASLSQLEKRLIDANILPTPFADIELLVSRYSYADLLPCSSVELEAFGIARLLGDLRTTTIGYTSSSRGTNVALFSRPNLQALVPFRPDLCANAPPKRPLSKHGRPHASMPVPAAASMPVPAAASAAATAAVAAGVAPVAAPSHASVAPMPSAGAPATNTAAPLPGVTPEVVASHLSAASAYNSVVASGGAPPKLITALLQSLPLAHAWLGPKVNPDVVLALLADATLPAGAAAGHDYGLPDEGSLKRKPSESGW